MEIEDDNSVWSMDARFKLQKRIEELSEAKNEVLRSSCCQTAVIHPDYEAAESAGSMWRAYVCYICKECGKACEVKQDQNDEKNEA